MSTNYSPTHTSGFMNEGVVVEDKLFDSNTHTRTVMIARGTVHARGEALGKITASGKYVLSTAAATDGSQVVDAILLCDVDATDTDAEQMVAISGDFAPQGLILGAGHTISSIADDCRRRGIILEEVIG